MTALRTVVVTPKGFVGGAERWLLSILDHADRLATTVVLLQDGPLRAELEQRDIDTIVLPTGASGLAIAGAGAQLWRRLRRLDPDVVLANGIKAATVAIGPARLLGIPSVWVRHEGSYANSLGRLAVRSADRTITVTPDESAAADEMTFVSPPLLDEPLPRSEADGILGSLGVPDDGLLRVGILARIARYKGIDTVIEALARPGGRPWRLVVAGIADPGDPQEQSRLVALAEDSGVADRVTWLGDVPAAGRLVTALDAVAVATRADVPGYPPGEGFGMTVVESFAGGVPVLADPATVPAVRLPGHLEAVVTIDADDPTSVATGLGVLADPELRAELAAVATQLGAKHPRPTAVADAVTQVLAQACHQPGAGLVDGPPFSVISTVRNERGQITRWLDAITTQLAAHDELVVVDGGSTDGTLASLREYAERDTRVRVIASPGAGISAGRNIAVSAASHDWIACTDAGCVPDPGWLAAFRRAASAGGIDLVTGVYRAGPVDGQPWELAMAAVGYPVPEELRRPSLLDRVYGRLFGRAYDATLPTGRSVAFTKQAWQLAGGYPEDLATAEDVLFGKRAVAAGAHAELAVDAAVTWDQRPTLRGNAKMFRGYGRGDGQSGDRQLIARNLARAGAYTVGPVLWLALPKARPLLLAAAAGYLCVPFRRAMRGPRPVATTALVPAMAATRDLAKAWGCLQGLAERRRSGT